MVATICTLWCALHLLTYSVLSNRAVSTRYMFTNVNVKPGHILIVTDPSKQQQVSHLRVTGRAVAHLEVARE